MTESDGEDPALLFSEPSAARPEEDTPPRPRKRGWGWFLFGLLVVIPPLLTLAGALTSPPHVKGVPVGHLIYLEADEPSDHTAMLRGLRIMGSDGSSHQLLHETEPQDSDSGSREWITQPQCSPDGQWLAFEKQVITLQEERQAVDNQLWVMPMAGPGSPPRLLLDMTAQHLKQFVGLTWTRDDKIVLLNDCVQYTINAAGSPTSETQLPLSGCSPQTAGTAISATRDPSLTASGLYGFDTHTPAGATIQLHSPFGDTILSYPRQLPPPWALSSDGRIAIASHGQERQIEIEDTKHSLGSEGLNARWGWSVFGRRHITAMKWSPDGKYLAYSVSKPPFEDELFYIDLDTGKCYQLPVRTGQTGWDWTP